MSKKEEVKEEQPKVEEPKALNMTVQVAGVSHEVSASRFEIIKNDPELGGHKVLSFINGNALAAKFVASKVDCIIYE